MSVSNINPNAASATPGGGEFSVDAVVTKMSKGVSSASSALDSAMGGLDSSPESMMKAQVAMENFQLLYQSQSSLTSDIGQIGKSITNHM